MKLSKDLRVKEFEQLGTEIMNRGGTSNCKFEVRWISHFQVVPYVIAVVWEMLHIDTNGEEDKGSEPKHLLWALLLLKTYQSEAVLAGICGCHEDTFRKWSWNFILKISYLEHEVVSCFSCCSINLWHSTY